MESGGRTLEEEARALVVGGGLREEEDWDEVRERDGMMQTNFFFIFLAREMTYARTQLKHVSFHFGRVSRAASLRPLTHQ